MEPTVLSENPEQLPSSLAFEGFILEQKVVFICKDAANGDLQHHQSSVIKSRCLCRNPYEIASEFDLLAIILPSGSLRKVSRQINTGDEPFCAKLLN